MTTTMDQVTQFFERLEGAQGESLRCSSWSELWAYAHALSNEQPVVSPDAYNPLQQGEVPDHTDPLGSVADRAVGITVAALGVAETGSVLLVEPSAADRAVSLLTHHLIVALREVDIVDTLAEGFAWLSTQPRAAAYATFVTGPSRTADIERSLTIGVQGPSRLTVAVLP